MFLSFFFQPTGPCLPCFQKCLCSFSAFCTVILEVWVELEDHLGCMCPGISRKAEQLQSYFEGPGMTPEFRCCLLNLIDRSVVRIKSATTLNRNWSFTINLRVPLISGCKRQVLLQDLCSGPPGSARRTTRPSGSETSQFGQRRAILSNQTCFIFVSILFGYEAERPWQQPQGGLLSSWWKQQRALEWTVKHGCDPPWWSWKVDKCGIKMYKVIPFYYLERFVCVRCFKSDKTDVDKCWVVSSSDSWVLGILSERIDCGAKKHTKITNPSLLRTIVKDELKESRQTLLDLQQKLADGSSKRGQEIPGKMLSDDPGQPLGISWVKNVSRRCFRDVVVIHVWIVGFLATAVKTQDDPRILSLRSQRRQLEEDWREQNDQTCVHYSSPFHLDYCDGLGFVMPFHAVLPWSAGPVPCGSNSPPGRHGISRFDWRAGTAVEGEEKG